MLKKVLLEISRIEALKIKCTRKKNLCNHFIKQCLSKHSIQLTRCKIFLSKWNSRKNDQKGSYQIYLILHISFLTTSSKAETQQEKSHKRQNSFAGIVRNTKLPVGKMWPGGSFKPAKPRMHGWFCSSDISAQVWTPPLPWRRFTLYGLLLSCII